MQVYDEQHDETLSLAMRKGLTVNKPNYSMRSQSSLCCVYTRTYFSDMSHKHSRIIVVDPASAPYAVPSEDLIVLTGPMAAAS